MFSHDGSIAPLKDYSDILPRGGLILLDDAHGVGILGKTGKGTLEHERVNRRRLIQTISLSKAFGSYGGAVLCSEELGERIQAKSRLFAGNTPLPLPLASAALKSLEILSSAETLRARLLKNIERVKIALREVGWPMIETPCPIIPLVPRHPDDVPRLKQQFIANGVFPSFIKYPGGPADGYFRFALSSEHDEAQIDALVRAFKGATS
jgi:glycine C-acetyltransferase/8-amino-7-oxononanoate synthase